MIKVDIKAEPIEKIFEYIDLQEDDVVLYLGGRIDDNNLYPLGYRKYLNSKIKELNPNKIICHTHWYASKYYDREILDESATIDMILVHHGFFKNDPLQTINPKDYGEQHHAYIETLIDKNPNMIYAVYQCWAGHTQPILTTDTMDVNSHWFGEDYDLNNVKYFTFSRSSCLSTSAIVTDGFAIIDSFVRAGFKNLNILGFSAFGGEEDMSYHTAYGSSVGNRFAGKKYFNINTSENQRAEADILKNYTEQKKIYNLEDYSKLMQYLFPRLILKQEP